MKKVIAKLLSGRKHQMLRISLFAIVISLIFGAVVLMLIGCNPFASYLNLLQGSGLAPKRSYAGS